MTSVIIRPEASNASDLLDSALLGLGDRNESFVGDSFFTASGAKALTDLLTQLTCHFSPCRTWRYSWKLIWDPSIPPKQFIALNPSTADEEQADPTVRRCIDYAKRWGAGGLVMTNAAAWRDTDPKAMLKRAKAGDDVIGPENTVAYLADIARRCMGNPIAAWGKHATEIKWETELSQCALNRHQELRQSIGALDCLAINKDGTPSHPLYLKADLLPKPFNY